MVYEISLILLVLFLGIAPHVLWLRWIIRAFRKRYAVDRVISVLSYLLFLIPFWALLQGNRRYYEGVLYEDHVLLGMGLLSILLPSVYCYGRCVDAAYRQKNRRLLYLRLSFLLLIPVIAGCLEITTALEQRSSISADLGLALLYWGTNLTKYTESKSGFRGEGEILAEIELASDVFEDLAAQIRETKFYDSSKQELHGGDELAWAQSDTVLYWKIRNHLEAQRLTGLWVYDQERRVYEFYEPSLSDIPNAAILFGESYTLSAELNIERRRLNYKRWVN